MLHLFAGLYLRVAKAIRGRRYHQARYADESAHIDGRMQERDTDSFDAVAHSASHVRTVRKSSINKTELIESHNTRLRYPLFVTVTTLAIPRDDRLQMKISQPIAAKIGH